MYSKLTKTVVLLLILFVVACLPSMAQTIFGSLTGEVLDASGAAVVGATVIIRNVNTGIERTTTADSSGFWRTPSLVIGQYEVSVTAPGFEKVVQTGIP